MPPKYPGKKFSFSVYDKQHLQNLVKQALKMDKIFKDAIQQGTQIGASTGFCDPNGEFLFDKFPAIKQRAEDLFTGMHDEIMLTITNGNREEWLLSAAKNNAMVDACYKKAAKQFGQQAEEWTDRHMKALEQFNKRVERGMNLSDRVWNLTTQFKQELELALEIGLGEGKSAAALTKDVRQYLNEPNKLFRRVRNEKGQLRLSKAAQAYHPGRGVYRSSYKNALRLTATENNMAYRTSDYERWQDMDFVTGMDIKLSNNHTLNGKPFVDICDRLQGKYPKDFKFMGWHPFCRCIAVPRLADEDEFIARQQALIDGESPADEPYGGEVTELPDNFQNWVEENAEKIETARNKPYFIQDNQQAIDNIINPPKEEKEEEAQEAPKPTPQQLKIESLKESLNKGFLPKECSAKLDELNGYLQEGNIDKFNQEVKPLETAAERHRNMSANDIAEIQKAWDERNKITEIRVAIDLKKVEGMADIQRIMDVFFDKFPEEFNNVRIQFKEFDEAPKKTANGTYTFTRGWSIHNKEIAFNSNVGLSKYSPKDYLLKALNKIKNDKNLNLEEHNVLRTVCHEMLHQKAKEHRTLKAHYQGDYKRTAMEVMNEYAARNTYADFLHKLGARNTEGADQMLRKGAGYKDWTKRLLEFGDKIVIDHEKTGKEFAEILTTKPYDTMDAELYNFFKSHVDPAKFTQDIDEVLEAFEKSKKDDWNKLMHKWFAK